MELTNVDSSVLPAGIRLNENDTRILSVAMHLAQEGQDVTVVSKDLPMRVKAASLGIPADEYLAEQAVDSGWTGVAMIDVSGATSTTHEANGSTATASGSPCVPTRRKSGRRLPG